MISYPVALTSCSTYDTDVVARAIQQQFELIGGVDRFVRPGDRVLLKPNFIAPRTADLAVQTHPAIILETARLLIDFGAKPMVGDSPAWGSVQSCANALELTVPLSRMNVPLVPLDRPRSCTLGDGQTKVGISQVALESDVIINLPKFKAHQQLMGTFAIKNMYGCVSGKKKPYWHYARGATLNQFCAFLIRIYDTVRPRLTLIDGITAMDGLGPINGRPRPLNYLIAGEDPIAVEYLCARLIGLDPDQLPMIRTARSIEFGCPGPDQIEVRGISGAAPRVLTDFDIPELIPVRFTLPRVIKSVFKGAIGVLKSKVPSRRKEPSRA